MRRPFRAGFLDHLTFQTSMLIGTTWSSTVRSFYSEEPDERTDMTKMGSLHDSSW